MKIAIVDNDLDAVAGMAELALSQGHGVLPLYASRYGPEPERLVQVISTGEILARLSAFAPDLVFLDHDLGLGFDYGATIAKQSEIPPEKLVGTSEVTRQNYCSKQFKAKGHFEMNKGYAKLEFLKFLASCTG